NTDKIAALVADCAEMKIHMLPPDVNASDWEFMPEGDAIRFGLGAIKGVGEAVIRTLVKTRKSKQPFTSFEDMVFQLPEKTLNKRVCESLLKAGAFNHMIPHLRAGLEGIPKALQEASRRRHDRLARQTGLFAIEHASIDGHELFADVEAWDERQCLELEREALGFYLTGHPLHSYLYQLSGLADIHLGDLPDCLDGAKVILPIFISTIKEYRTARGMMAFIQVEDLHGRAEMVVFAKLYETCREIIQAGEPLLLAAKVDASKDEPTLIAEAVSLLDDVLPQLVRRITVSFDAISLTAEQCQILQKLSSDKEAGAQWRFQLRLSNGSIATLESNRPAPPWTSKTRRILQTYWDKQALHVQCATWKPEIEEARSFRKKSD
ncbi:MAG: DNA polymerase III subunit alpha, partial [Mariprofundaceae bacterium]|nr:DNA polymerase III subunit alpha [Mariprofundaceae bacterium]